MRYLWVLLLYTTSVFAHQEQFHLITYANYLIPEVNNLRVTAKQNNMRLKILGKGDKDFYFTKRIKAVRKYLYTPGVSDDDIVMFVDAFDVLVMQPKSEIIKRFEALNCPIVFSAEKNCFPFSFLQYLYPESPSEHRYLNAGGYIGYVWALKALFERVDYSIRDDQGLFSEYYVQFPDRDFILDYKNSIFLCLEQVTPDELQIDYQKRKVFYLPTESYPCIIHGNGGGKELYYLLAHWIRKKSTKQMKRIFPPQISS